MCGGAIEFENGSTVGVCDSCGTKQTLPKIDIKDDRKSNLYDRANHFRRNNDFDKAMGIYEQILNDDPTDSEAYWSIVLCRYGIEYVEDPVSHKRVPTVNRAQYTSIFADEDYRSAIKNADIYQKMIYEEEAKAIDEIQKGILEISQKEEPFDVFICYKETDNNGRRTQDSVLANDLYHQLTQEGYKVFFSRITLEDKLGTAYEPYIFAALNSAKVMVVIGTKPEYFNAVWVRNEWSRFLSLIKKGEKKILVPAYRDMDPYDLPEEFSHLQAQDMGKLGFMQDLIRGISKILNVTETKPVVKETVIVENNSSNSNIASLLKRAYLFMEDNEWEEADAYCERVLDIDPENAEAYLVKMMIELKVYKQEDLKNLEDPFDQLNSYKKVIRFADDKLKSVLDSYIVEINHRKKVNNAQEIYDVACELMRSANNKYYGQFALKCLSDAVIEFEKVEWYKDSKERIKQCLEREKELRYEDACESFNKALEVEIMQQVADEFKSLIPYKDSELLYEKCLERIKSIKIGQIKNRMMVEDMDESYYRGIIKKLREFGDNKDSKALIHKCEEKIKILLSENKSVLKDLTKLSDSNVSEDLFSFRTLYDQLENKSYFKRYNYSEQYKIASLKELCDKKIEQIELFRDAVLIYDTSNNVEKLISAKNKLEDLDSVLSIILVEIKEGKQYKDKIDHKIRVIEQASIEYQKQYKEQFELQKSLEEANTRFEELKKSFMYGTGSFIICLLGLVDCILFYLFLRTYIFNLSISESYEYLVGAISLLPLVIWPLINKFKGHFIKRKIKKIKKKIEKLVKPEAKEEYIDKFIENQFRQ